MLRTEPADAELELETEIFLLLPEPADAELEPETELFLLLLVGLFVLCWPVPPEEAPREDLDLQNATMAPHHTVFTASAAMQAFETATLPRFARVRREPQESGRIRRRG